MKVYLICKDIDMGYHVHGVMSDEDKAKQIVENKNYTLVKEFPMSRPKWFIEEFEIDEL